MSDQTTYSKIGVHHIALSVPEIKVAPIDIGPIIDAIAEFDNAISLESHAVIGAIHALAERELVIPAPRVDVKVVNPDPKVDIHLPEQLPPPVNFSPVIQPAAVEVILMMPGLRFYIAVNAVCVIVIVAAVIAWFFRWKGFV